MSIHHNKKSLRDKKNQSGFSIIEIMLALALITIGSMATLSFISSVNSSNRAMTQYSGRNTIQAKITHIVSSPATLYWSTIGVSATQNLALKRCVLGNIAGACQGDLVWRGVDLLVPNISTYASRSPTSSSSALYNAKTFERCAATAVPSIDCPFDVRTEFRATCPNRGILGSSSTCKLADSIEIRFTVNQVWNGDNSEQIKLRDRSGVISVSNREISLFKTQAFIGPATGAELGCPVGEVSIGYSGDGQFICQKLDHVCPAGTVAVGVDKFGRPVSHAAAGENIGQFFNDSGIAKVRCISANCGTSEMVGIVMGGTTSPYDTMCATGEATCDLNDSNVLLDILADGGDANYMGDPLCAQLNNCRNINPAGTDMTQLNFTAAFTSYNTPINKTVMPLTGGVTSTCEPFSCGLNQYMTNWTPQGNCTSTVIPPACIPTIWSPDESTVCSAVAFTQTSNCGTTRPATGTSVTGVCAPVCVPGPWVPDPALTCTSLTIMQFNGCTHQVVPGTAVCSTPTPTPTPPPPPPPPPPPASCSGSETGVLSVGGTPGCGGFFATNTNPATTNVGTCNAGVLASMVNGEYCTFLTTEDPAFGFICSVVWFEACPTVAPPGINGQCGSSHNTSSATAPATGLCYTGTASAVSGSGPWTWTCSGSGGGTSESCSANLTVPPPPPTASCVWGRPFGWAPPAGHLSYCVEYATMSTHWETIPHGFSQNYSFNYCLGNGATVGTGQKPCWGSFNVSCNNGVTTFSGQDCNYGAPP